MNRGVRCHERASIHMDGEEDSRKIPSESKPELATNMDASLTTMSSQLPAFSRPMQSSSVITPVDGCTNTSNILHENVPANATNIDEVDSLIAKQMMKLSVEEREKAYMDLHAVKNEDPIETTEAIQAGLDSLNDAIENLQDKHAYDLAWSMNSEYVENPSFRLAFLRADSFHARRAALRIVRHFQVKLDLFGEDKMVTEIVQDDLDRETMDAMYCGRGQWLDAKDRAGRHIIVAFYGDQFSTKATLQRGFYNGMNATRNSDAQIRGFVVVIYLLARPSAQQDIEKHWSFVRLTDGVPARIEAIHFCHDGQISQELFAVSKAALAPFVKTRTRTHSGTHDEIMSSLAGFGIASETIPVAEGCKITNLEAYHQRLIEMRSVERRQQPSREKVSVPSRFDILFGKGTPFQKHPGNVQLRSLVSKWRKEYEKAKKGQKRHITQEIVQTIQQNSGFFLRPDGDSWVRAEDDVARQKVSALFRTARLNSR